MKNNSHAPAQLSPLPRLKDLPPSNFLPLLIFSVLLIIFCFAGIGRAQSANMTFIAANYTVPAKDTGKISTLEFRVFELVNDERIKNGREPLIWTDRAAAAARYHSANMAEHSYLSHTDLVGEKVDDRANKFGLNDWRWIGENIAWLSGYADPATRVVECWMKSPGHRQNILQPKYREGGIGMALSADGKYYFTQVFVFRK